MPSNAKVPVIARLDQTLYDQLKALQYEEAKGTEYRVTLQDLVIKAIKAMLNEEGVDTDATVEKAATAELILSKQKLQDSVGGRLPPQMVYFHIEALKKYRRLLGKGVPLRETVEAHLAEWEKRLGDETGNLTIRALMTPVDVPDPSPLVAPTVPEGKGYFVGGKEYATREEGMEAMARREAEKPRRELNFFAKDGTAFATAKEVMDHEARKPPPDQ